MAIKNIGHQEMLGDSRVWVSTDKMVVAIIMETIFGGTWGKMLSHIDSNVMVGSLDIADVD